VNRRTHLVIFDCDGVLVDSEPLSIRVLVEGLASIGYRIDEATASERFLGHSLAAVQGMLRDELGFDLPTDRLEAMRLSLFERFRRELKPMPGIVEALDRLAVPCCVASSSLLERIRISLEVTGLLGRFAPNIFSAEMVQRGKPAPDLFLYAAERMGVEPADCLVIEDSAPGIAAAHSAGMRVFAFLGGSHARQSGYRDRLARLGPEREFDDMRKLPGLLEANAAAIQERSLDRSGQGSLP
jgi:HAD superfamily hydrolase (TIGR01509 family)